MLNQSNIITSHIGIENLFTSRVAVVRFYWLVNLRKTIDSFSNLKHLDNPDHPYHPDQSVSQGRFPNAGRFLMAGQFTGTGFLWPLVLYPRDPL